MVGQNDSFSNGLINGNDNYFTILLLFFFVVVVVKDQRGYFTEFQCWYLP